MENCRSKDDEIRPSILMPAPDHSEIVSIEKRMKTAAKRMHEMVGEMATAMTVLEYDGDRRKNLLARYALPHIKAGESAAASETLARADSAYDAELNQLMGQYELAQSTRKKHDAEHVSWETARSLLSMQRQQLNTLPDYEN